jgi:sulfopropanediol 3-dehydrogenase
VALERLKRASGAPASHDEQTRVRVAEMLANLEREGEAAARRYSRELDSWDPPSFLVEPGQIARARAELPARVLDDIAYAYENVRTFAERQRASLEDFEIELRPGLVAGQRQVPVDVAGCYVPGGRYAHVASALMSVGTARAAGVPFVVACAPPRPGGNGVHPATLCAMETAGADAVLCLGGVQAIAAMAFGLFTGRQADVLAGPGNRFVAEAKRLLYGRVGIDLFAGPTEVLVIADEHADPWILALDLVSQAEHGPESPAILVTTSRRVGEEVLRLVPDAAAGLLDRQAAEAAWRDRGEVVVAATREEAAQASDAYASEHVEIHAAELDWWRDRLRNYGTLFLGEETTVAYGDKAAGPNHVLPTKRAARYTGGLWVGKFLKTLTWQRMTREGNRELGSVAARLSRVEGMEGHARAGDGRLEKYFPGEPFEVGAPEAAR